MGQTYTITCESPNLGPPLGKVSIVPASSPEWNINQAIAVFRPVQSLDRRFLAFWLLSGQLLNWAVTRSKATAGQSNLTLQTCRDLPIPLCSLQEQQQIVRRVEYAFGRIEKLAAEAQRATDLRDCRDQTTLARPFKVNWLTSLCFSEPHSPICEAPTQEIARACECECQRWTLAVLELAQTL